MTTSPNRSSRTAARGFTLIELMLVLMILGLAATLVWPSLGAFSRRVAGEAGRFDLVGLLRQARWWSAATGQICTVQLDASQERCQIAVQQGSGAGGEMAAVDADWTELSQPPKVTGLTEIAPGGSHFKSGRMTVVFTPCGVQRDYLIDFAGDHAQAARIEIRRPSGLIWLVPSDVPAGLAEDNLDAVDTYWRSHYRDVDQR